MISKASSYLLSALLLILILPLSIRAQSFETHTYFTTDSVDLELDLFLPTQTVDSPRALVIFVHGGGFVGGKRDAGHAMGAYLAENNIAMATITYTLLMKGRGFGCDVPTADKVQAIRVAASQTWEATSFLLAKAQELQIDPTQIFLAGSSAGAETVLHAAFWDREEMKLTDHSLPADFKYAGVISGAGAIMDLNLITRENVMPVFAFHGDDDELVPYATAAHHYCSPDSPGWLMLFGSKSIVDHVTALGSSAQLISFAGGSHGHAGEYFFEKQNRIASFIELVMSGATFTATETRPGE